MSCDGIDICLVLSTILGVNRRRHHYQLRGSPQRREFTDVYHSISQYTIVSEPRCRAIYALACEAKRLPGDAAELGVYNGGISMLLSLVFTDKVVHAFDTFQGICNASEEDLHHNGDFSDVLPGVVLRLQRFGIAVHQGYFPTTTRELPAGQRFAFAHFDGDTYQSAVDFLEFFYPRTVPGGILVFDDYLWKHCPGVEHALRDFMNDKPEQLTVTAPYQCCIRRGICC